MNEMPITLVEHRPEWPGLFQQEEARLQQAAGSAILRLEHIGSTAVPDLLAKPVIDILGGIHDLAAVAALQDALAGLGYEYVAEFEQEIPERRFFRKYPQNGTYFHLHIVEQGSGFWRDHLLFRDYLRAHPEVALAYGELKRSLADLYYQDRGAYTRAKKPFIESVLARIHQGEAVCPSE